MDTIGLEGVECTANIGLLDWEQQIEQTLKIDLQLRGGFSRQIDSDDLPDNGLDYSQVHQWLLETVASRPWQLIETLAEAVSHGLLQAFPIDSVTIRVTKPGILPKVQKVWVELERSKAQ